MVQPQEISWERVSVYMFSDYMDIDGIIIVESNS